jgi:hypothetical protein
MRYNNVSLSVLIKGKSITEYPHNGQVFVEGRSGSNFEIEIINHNGFRVEAIVSVDGLSVIDGKDAGPTSPGYLLEAGETIRIPGWKLNDQQVAAFEFAAKSGSYAGQSTGSTRNTGVIGLMVYREKPRYEPPVFRIQPLLYHTSPSFGPDHSRLRRSAAHDAWSGLESFGTCSVAASDALPTNAVMGSAAASYAPTSAPIGGAVSRGIKGDRGDQGPAGVAFAATEAQPAPVEQVLGTAFGQAQDFATQTVSFERGDLHALLAMYYDDARTLRARGIVLDRRSKSKAHETPNPFPGASCVPPAGWRG